jgi:hypothetical protein
VKSVLPFVSVLIIAAGMFSYLWLMSSEYAFHQALEKRADELVILNSLAIEGLNADKITDSLIKKVGDPTLNETENIVIAQALFEECVQKNNEEVCLKALFQSNFVIQQDSLNLEVYFWRYHILLHLGDTAKAEMDYEILTAAGYKLNQEIK